MDLGVHLPLMGFGAPLSARRLVATVDAAVEHGFAALTVNDHLVFRTPWLDGLTALASVVSRSGDLELATTVALPVLRGPAALAKSLAALDVLSGGRMVPALGPGSSPGDFELAGKSFDDRWSAFEEAVRQLRRLLAELEPRPVAPLPLWIGSWGSPAGLRRVTRLGDGWLASAYNTTPEVFARGLTHLPVSFPSAVATMWTCVTSDPAPVLAELGMLVGRPADQLAPLVCVGSREHCADVLRAYADAGCGRVYLWPIGEEATQLALVAREVVPLLA